MSNKRMLTVAEASELTGIPIPTLNTWRSRGLGPVYQKYGYMVRYPADKLDAYIRKCTIIPVVEDLRNAV